MNMKNFHIVFIASAHKKYIRFNLALSNIFLLSNLELSKKKFLTRLLEIEINPRLTTELTFKILRRIIERQKVSRKIGVMKILSILGNCPMSQM